jgi:hypothetical protein
MKGIVKQIAKHAWASQLLENIRCERSSLRRVCSRRRALDDIVEDAFCWDATPQGYDYWEEIYYNEINNATCV